MKKFKKAIILSVIAAVVVGGFFGYRSYKNSQAKVEYSTVPAVKGRLIQTVTATGSVKASANFDLNFKITGKLNKMNVKVGDEVKAGSILAELDSSDTLIELKQAEASLRLSEANLAQKLAGETSESLKVYEEKVKEAEAALGSAEQNLKDANIDLDNVKTSAQEDVKDAELSVETAGVSLDNAKKSLDNAKATYDQNIAQAYENAKTAMDGYLISIAKTLTDADNILGVDNTTANDAFEYYLGIYNEQTEIDAKNAYTVAKESKVKAENAVSGLTENSYAKIDAAIPTVKNALNDINNVLMKTRTLLDSSITGTGLTQSDLSTKKTAIDADRSTVNSSIGSLESYQQKISSAKLSATSGNDAAQTNYDSAKNNYDSSKQNLIQVKATAQAKISASQAKVNSAQNQAEIQKAAVESAKAALALKQAKPREVDIANLKAQIQGAQAAADLIRNKLNNTILKAPVDGVITAVNFEIGEQTNLNQAVVLMLAKDNFQIEVETPEADISKIKVGNDVDITLDAFGDEKVFKGKVIFINPAATIIAGVTYYQVKIGLESRQSGMEIKSGMTANVTIKTEEKENVLIIPQRALEYQEGKKTVKILENGEEKIKEVAVGLKGDEGMVEIIEGLKEGDKVITFVNPVQ